MAVELPVPPLVEDRSGSERSADAREARRRARGPQAPRPRIVAFAYACTPGAGSEGGAGWAWAEMLARIGEVWVLTRPFAARRQEIESRLTELPPAERPHVVFVDLPLWAGGGRPTASSRLLRLRYLFWQALALRVARRLHHRRPFDLAWHLTFSNVWVGSLACLIGPPFVYGPVGGGVGPPWRLVPRLGWRGTSYEVLRALGRFAGRHLSPIVRLDWQRAALILAQNRETRDWFPAPARGRIEVFPNVILGDEPLARDADVPRPSGGSPVALFAGRLMPLKGVALALEALRRLPGWQLVICGDGPDEPRLRRLADRLGLGGRVDFRGWVPRDEVLALMRRADVLLFPSFHEEAGWAVAEALAVGLPVVALARGGPAALPVHGVPAGWPGATVRGLARAVEAARKAPRPAPPHFDEATRRTELVALLAARGLLSERVGEMAVSPVRART